jgi:hypothetical protein
MQAFPSDSLQTEMKCCCAHPNFRDLENLVRYHEPRKNLRSDRGSTCAAFFFFTAEFPGKQYRAACGLLPLILLQGL